jgi:hypothetical protein
MARHIDVRRPEPHRLRARPVLSYRACEFTTGVEGLPALIGGLSIPYATIPMNRRIGITIGGTRYFMVFPLLGEPDRCRITTRVIAVRKSARQTSSLKYNIVSFAMITRRCVIFNCHFPKTPVRYDRKDLARLQRAAGLCIGYWFKRLNSTGAQLVEAGPPQPHSSCRALNQ